MTIGMKNNNTSKFRLFWQYNLFFGTIFALRYLFLIRVDEELNKLIVEESDSRQKEEKASSIKEGDQADLQSQIDADGDVHGGGIGTISFVSCGNKEAKEAADATLADSAREEGKSKEFWTDFTSNFLSSSSVGIVYLRHIMELSIIYFSPSL